LIDTEKDKVVRNVRKIHYVLRFS